MGNSSSDEKARLEACESVKRATFYKALPTLAKSLSGPLVFPQDCEAYMKARSRPFRHDCRGFPLVIAYARCTADVVKCIDFMRTLARGVPLSIFCGGTGSKCMETNSFVLDLSQMNQITVSVAESKIVVGGGATAGHVTAALAPYGIGLPVGTFGQVGIGGLCVSGGFGWLTRLFGFTVDNLLQVEVVLANGKVVVASDENKYAPLLYGVRGGGGGFGIITEFVFRVHKLPSHCYAGSIVYLADRTSTALAICKLFDQLVQELPDSTTGIAIFDGQVPTVRTLWMYLGDCPSLEHVVELQAAGHLGEYATVENSVKKINFHRDLEPITSPLLNIGQPVCNALVQIGAITQQLPSIFFSELLQFTRKRALTPCLSKGTVILFTMGGKLFFDTENGRRSAVSKSIRNARYFAIVEASWKKNTGEAGKKEAKQWIKEAVQILRRYSTPRSRGSIREITGLSPYLRPSEASLSRHSLADTNNTLRQQSSPIGLVNETNINRKGRIRRHSAEPMSSSPSFDVALGFSTPGGGEKVKQDRDKERIVKSKDEDLVEKKTKNEEGSDEDVADEIDAEGGEIDDGEEGEDESDLLNEGEEDFLPTGLLQYLQNSRRKSLGASAITTRPRNFSGPVDVERMNRSSAASPSLMASASTPNLSSELDSKTGMRKCHTVGSNMKDVGECEDSLSRMMTPPPVPIERDDFEEIHSEYTEKCPSDGPKSVTSVLSASSSSETTTKTDKEDSIGPSSGDPFTTPAANKERSNEGIVSDSTQECGSLPSSKLSQDRARQERMIEKFTDFARFSHKEFNATMNNNMVCTVGSYSAPPKVSGGSIRGENEDEDEEEEEEGYAGTGPDGRQLRMSTSSTASHRTAQGQNGDIVFIEEYNVPRSVTRLRRIKELYDPFNFFNQNRINDILSPRQCTPQDERRMEMRREQARQLREQQREYMNNTGRGSGAGSGRRSHLTGSNEI